jgi:type VI secretion system protein ImpF
MSSSARKNRLSPPLMYAFRSAHDAGDAKKKLDLREQSGERVLAGRRASARAIITEAVLRREVSHDLEQLMNTINLAAAIDLDGHEAVRRSILNFGFPDVTHRSIDEYSIDDIRLEIAAALRDFEPRILGDTIEVDRDNAVRKEELKIRFVVRADLSCEPVNVPVEFIADLELDTGKIVINRL